MSIAIKTKTKTKKLADKKNVEKKSFNLKYKDT